MKPTLALIAQLLAMTIVIAACDTRSPPTAKEHGEARDEHSGDTSTELIAHLSDEQLADARIELVAAAPARIGETLSLYGVITPNATAVRQVTARFPGVIRSISRSFGDAVKQGEMLAVVESNESLQRYDIASPISGVVTARDANLGEQTGERVLFTVADLSSVWVELSLFPRDVGKVRIGQSVRIRAADSAGSADGKVIWIAPFGSSANQTLSARVLLDNAERRWAPGLYVTAEITLAETDVPVAVRNDALQTLGDRTVVFVRETEGFKPRGVRIGRADHDYSEVVSGLAAGDVYAARNSFILKAELGKGSAEHEE